MRVQKGDGCWNWTGRTVTAGYGKISVGGRYVGAHRVSYTLAVGAIPPGLCVLHRCDNRKCVRPDHLFLGTKKDNTQDMLRKGRHTKPYRNRTHCRNGHELALVGVVRVKESRGECDYCRKCYDAARERANARARLARSAKHRQEVAA